MAIKKPAPPAGAPEWVVTYGDMMSLLLCFFILLCAFANFSKEDQMLMSAMESVREALGSPGQSGWNPEDRLDFNSTLVRMLTLVIDTKTNKVSNSDQPGVRGEYYRVTQIRDGLQVVVGGPVAFDRFSAELKPGVEQVLEQIAKELNGRRNKIEIRGHATDEPLTPDSPFSDALDLSYVRARQVRDRLVALGVNPRAIRISAAGPFEPLLKQAYDETRRASNRRVEILLSQSLLSDYKAAPQALGVKRGEGDGESATSQPAGRQ